MLYNHAQAAIERDPEYVEVLTNMLKEYYDQRAVLLRIAFVLGNLTTGSNNYRKQVESHALLSRLRKL
jgi:hypothetical protein